jgi:hypothetical protein
MRWSVTLYGIVEGKELKLYDSFGEWTDSGVLCYFVYGDIR